MQTQLCDKGAFALKEISHLNVQYSCFTTKISLCVMPLPCFSIFACSVASLAVLLFDILIVHRL